MTDESRTRIHSVLEEVCDAMRFNHPVWDSLAISQQPIPKLIGAARPKPALRIGAAFHFCPISFEVTRAEWRERLTLHFSHCVLLYRSLWSGPGGATNAA